MSDILYILCIFMFSAEIVLHNRCFIFCIVGFDLGLKAHSSSWGPTSTFRSFTVRNKVMLWDFCYVLGAGSIASWRKCTEPQDHHVQIKLAEWDIKLSKVWNYARYSNEIEFNGWRKSVMNCTCTTPIFLVRIMYFWGNNYRGRWTI